MDPTARDGTSTIETRRRHIIENREKAAAYVQNLELRLGIPESWTPNSEEFQETARLVAMRDYQRALDTLEGLVVARIFELASMNRAGMGKLILCAIVLTLYQLTAQQQATKCASISAKPFNHAQPPYAPL